VTNLAPTIGLVDDDPALLRSLERLLKSHGFNAESYASAEELLARRAKARLSCLVLDVSMPGIGGLELQQKLRRKWPRLPVVFLTGQGDIPMSVKALKSGAVDFLTKPVEQEELLAALKNAIALGAKAEIEAQEVAELQARISQLSPRELEVLRHVVSGSLNKQIAAKLGVSEQTVKIHRMRITQKTGIPDVPTLVRTLDRLQITPLS